MRHLTPKRCVLTDAEFDSERNYTCIRQVVAATGAILAKRGKKMWHLRGVQAQVGAGVSGE